MLKSSEIRRLYIEFFQAREHHLVPSSPIVPPDDPTLLFTTAGMVQFKRLYSGAVELPYKRATSVQKCLRAGGKGSDLENVGHTLRHHTFFEMLGNFSFGDYFKREAIHWAWEFSTEVLKLDKARIYASVYKDDDEAWDIWTKEIGMPEDHMVRLGDKDNFWGPAGETGACGPCSEIYYDRGAQYGEGLTFQYATINDDDPMTRYIEYWNCVFPQYDQQKDGSRPPLKNRGVDTGMGLERLCCIVQDTASPFETDLFQPICAHVIKIAGLKGTYKELPLKVRQQVNVVADHVRALTFALSEGILPSNEGRGYVLRRLLRRAARYGKHLGINRPFMAPIVDTVVEVMSGFYPDLKKHVAIIKRVIMTEEESYANTLAVGQHYFEAVVDKAKNSNGVIDGEDAFNLSTTHGLHIDDIREMAVDQGLKLDQNSYLEHIKEHQKISRKGAKGSKFGELQEPLREIFDQHGATVFTGFPIDEEDIDLDALLESTEADAKDFGPEPEPEEINEEDMISIPEEEADQLWDEINAYPMIEYAGMTLLAAFADDKSIKSAKEGDEVALVFDATNFYAESGGQVADTGKFLFEHGEVQITDVQKTTEDIFVHFGLVTRGSIAINEVAVGIIDGDRRWDIMRNHTSAHLLQAAMKQVLGDHVTQQGSYVCPDYLRFDFTNPEAVTPEQIEKIERIVNENIRRDIEVSARELSIEDARKVPGVVAPFGEIYGQRVRVIEIPDCSAEFCGGTHMPATGGIGTFLIRSESAIASGIRRIESVTGRGAVEMMQQERALLSKIAGNLSVGAELLPERIEAMQNEIKNLRHDMAQVKAAHLAEQGATFLQQAPVYGDDIKVVCKVFDGMDGTMLRQVFDGLKSHRPEKLVAVLGANNAGKATLLAAATPDVTKKVHAGNLIKQLAPVIGGKGGGKPEMAQAGGTDTEKLQQAISTAENTIKELLQ